MNEQEYLEERLEDQIKWFNAKSVTNKKKYQTCQVILLVLAALVTVSGVFKTEGSSWVGFAVPMLGALIAVITGIMSLYKYQENWLNYRTAAEALLHEKFLFLTKSDPYNIAEPLNLLVTRSETIISKENAKWAQYTNSSTSASTSKAPKA